MSLEDKIIPLKEIIPMIIFWIKPSGEDYCNGIYKDKELNVCMKSILMMTRRYPIECKYLEPNYDFPTLTKCSYKK